MLRRIPASEFVEWEEYSDLEPWGSYRSDLQTGVIASVVANLVRSEGHEPAKPSDFVLKFERRIHTPPEMQKGVEAEFAAWSLFAQSHNAYVRRMEQQKKA